jgi:CheY-like chemotaxis protein
LVLRSIQAETLRFSIGLLALLTRLGITTSVTSNGREARDRLGQERFDAILMDCLMPEMDGFEATRELRRREAATGQRRTPVIALTASALASDRERCAQAGMDDFLTRPIHGHNLQATLDRWLRTKDDAASASGATVAELAAPPETGVAANLDKPTPTLAATWLGVRPTPRLW